ncbi:MAG: NACHT domain-containing protein [Gallionella sp.]
MISGMIVGAAAKSTITALVKPAIEKAFSGLKAVPSKLVDIFTDKFSSYLEIQLERHAYLNTIVFNAQTKLEDLYIPLTVIPSIVGIEKSEKDILLDSFKKQFLPEHNRVLVTDTAGMGKSTLMKFLFLQCLKTNCAIPIFVELRHLSQDKTMLDLIEQQLNPSSNKQDPSYLKRPQIERVIKKGGLVFFLDGYDEIAYKDREKVTIDLKSFIEKFPDNMIAITSRPETGLSAFPSFKQYTIRPLEKEESFALIRKYDKNGTRSQQLIERLKGKEFRGVMEFLKNPLLTTLLYRCYEYKQNLPLKKHVFYRQVFDALFDWHDSSKDGYNTREKKSKLDIDSFHRILRVMGIISVMKGVVEGDKDTVLDWIRSAKDICVGTSFSESDFLDDIIRAVPVFVKDGAYYRWSHKSLAEYFAAQYVCTEGKQTQEQIFAGMLKDGQLHRFSNVLDQIYDLDLTAFRKYFMLPVAREFSAYWKDSYKGFAGLIPIKNVELRKCITFGSRYIISNSKDLFNSSKSESEIYSLLGLSESKGLSLENLSVSVSLVEQKTKGGTNIPIILFSVPRPFTTILNILDLKKDNVMQNKTKIDLSGFKNVPTKSVIKKTVEITDNAKSGLNSKRNFNPITKLIYMDNSSVVVNPERMLNFESSLQDEIKVNNFATELLTSIDKSSPASKTA